MVKSNTSAGKKHPKCQTCHQPTQGHPRRGRKFTCKSDTPTSSPSPSSGKSSSLRLSTPLPSPPASPPATTPSPSPDTEREGFKLPPGTTWHWRNPNWNSPPPKMRCHSPSDLERASLAPTEPLTEIPEGQWGGHSVHTVFEEDEPVDGESQDGDFYEDHEDFLTSSMAPRQWSPLLEPVMTDVNFRTALRASTPLFNVFRTPREDLPEVTRTAQLVGKHVGIINAPVTHSGTSKIPKEKADGTVWVLVSDREEDLKYAVDSQQRGMPGMFFQEDQWNCGLGLLHVALAGVFGGIVVMLGLAYL